MLKKRPVSLLIGTFLLLVSVLTAHVAPSEAFVQEIAVEVNCPNKRCPDGFVPQVVACLSVFCLVSDSDQYCIVCVPEPTGN
ncbi:MAG: hypothetical protein GY719_39365 [bacterium]|nr:hypothetical protein [bacterium]